MSYYPEKPSKLQRLKDRVDELEEKNERLRDCLRSVIKAVRGRIGLVGNARVYNSQIEVDRVEQWQDVLDRRGGNDD